MRQINPNGFQSLCHSMYDDYFVVIKNLWLDFDFENWDSTKHNQKLFRLKEAHTELAHQIWDKSNQHFVCKCTKMAWPIRGQKMREIHHIIVKGLSGQGILLDKWKARKPQEFSRASSSSEQLSVLCCTELSERKLSEDRYSPKGECLACQHQKLLKCGVWCGLLIAPC